MIPYTPENSAKMAQVAEELRGTCSTADEAVAAGYEKKKYVRADKRVTMEWQPIETAPKDGSLFVGWVSAERWSRPDGEGSGIGHDVSEMDFCQWRSYDDHPEGGCFINMMGQIGDMQDITHWVAGLKPPSNA